MLFAFTFKTATFFIFSKDGHFFDGCFYFFSSGFFQLADGFRRPEWYFAGFEMTKECMKVTLISHWFVGLPIGCFLGFHSKWGPVGLWAGLLISLFLVGGLLFYLFLRKKRELSHTPHI